MVKTWLKENIWKTQFFPFKAKKKKKCLRTMVEKIKRLPTQCSNKKRKFRICTLFLDYVH